MCAGAGHKPAASALTKDTPFHQGTIDARRILVRVVVLQLCRRTARRLMRQHEKYYDMLYEFAGVVTRANEQSFEGRKPEAIAARLRKSVEAFCRLCMIGAQHADLCDSMNPKPSGSLDAAILIVIAPSRFPITPLMRMSAPISVSIRQGERWQGHPHLQGSFGKW